MEPITIAMVFVTATQTFKLPEHLLSALCYVESTHNIHAVHKDDGSSSSLGLCQIKLTTARLLGFKGTEAKLMKPAINAYYAAKYLKKQLVRYDGDTLKAVAAYNSGSYKERNNSPINKQYVTKVFRAWLEKR